MSIWKEIKYALNSTIGTNKFKPLDELIALERDLVASDNLYRYIYDPNNVSSSGHYYNFQFTSSDDSKWYAVFKFIADANGSIRFKCDGRSGSRDSSFMWRLGEEEALKNASSSSYNGSFAYDSLGATQTVDINIEKGKTYAFEVYYSQKEYGNVFILGSAAIYADWVNISGLKDIEYTLTPKE